MGTTRSRRGRPRADEREARRRRIIDAAYEELVEYGYERLTMLGIAHRAGASKETLYSWFGSREGLFAALIQDNADHAATRVADALRANADPRETLTAFATGLLTLLTGDRSVALNRAAMQSDELAEVLLASGRHRVGPLIEEYLAQTSDDGGLAIDDPEDAFRVLFGLVVQDTQIRVLLGEPPPSKSALKERAATAIDQFFSLFAA